MRASRGVKPTGKPGTAPSPEAIAVLRADAFTSMRKKEYEELSGRKTQVLHEQAKLYGLPLTGATINLRVLLPAFHDLLAKHGRILSAAIREGTGGQQGGTALERMRDANAQLAELELAKERGNLVDIETMDEGLSLLADRLRKLGDALGRKYGPAAAEMLEEAIGGVVQLSESMGGKEGAAA